MIEKVKLLKYGRKVAGEKRSADFLKEFGREVETTRIISFGACNYHCDYCKRDGQQIDSDGNIVRSIDVPWSELKTVIDEAVGNGERIRLSGGDPVMFPKESLFIAQYVMDTHGQKISMAHNGSSLSFAKLLAPYLEYAAIDLKAGTSKEMAFRSGLREERGDWALNSTLDVQDFLSSEGILVDIRTPVFGDTSLDSLFEMAELIERGGDNSKEFWTLRKYNAVRHCNWPEPNPDTLSQWARLVSEEHPHLPIGIKEKWTGNKTFNILKGGKECK